MPQVEAEKQGLLCEEGNRVEVGLDLLLDLLIRFLLLLVNLLRQFKDKNYCEWLREEHEHLGSVVLID